MSDFYSIDKKTAKSLFYEAKGLSHKCWCDELDALDWKRVPSIKSFDDVFKILETDICSEYKFMKRNLHNETYLEIVGYGIANKITYFIFMYLDIKHMDTLIKKYDLKQLA